MARRDARRSEIARAAPGLTARLVSPAGLTIVLASTVLIGAVFRTWDGLDLATARLFYSADDHFLAYAEAGGLLRAILFVVPWTLLAVMAGLALLRASGRARAWLTWAPSWRGVVFLGCSMAVGPGLLVNGILKDTVHRPRPAQILEFGGPARFQPVGSIEGDCPRNCSFVSGEVAMQAWTASAVLLIPTAAQPLGLAVALGLTVAASLSRMSFGAHFLSDTLLAASLTWLVTIASWWLVFGLPRLYRIARPAAPARATS